MARQTHTITVPPPWFPMALLPSFSGRITFHWSRHERRVYRRKKYMRPSKWAEKNRYITQGPLAGSKWSNSLAAYLTGILDAAFFLSVRVVIFCKAVQVGGTTMMESAIGYAADRRPGRFLIVYPDRETARENNKDNLQPMITASPILRSLMTGVDDDMASLRIKLKNMLINMGWAGSATSLGNKSVMYLVLDEIDKYPPTPDKREAGTIALAMKRVTAFPHDRKIFKNSTPTIESGNIWQALNKEAQVIFEYCGRCPVCEEMQPLIFDRKDEAGNLMPGGIRWPDDERDPEIIENEKLAWYECEYCRKPWTDTMRDRAVRQGEWRAKSNGQELFSYLREHRPKKIGFHLPAWPSPFVSLSESAAAFIRGQADRTALKDFCNNYAAMPWQEVVGKERRLDAVMALKDDRPAGLVPSWTLALLLTADVQKEGIWYELRAWGEHRTSALLRYGYLAKGFGEAETNMTADFVALRAICREPYHTGDKEVHQVRFGLVDSRYRTEEVYEFCRQLVIMAPSMGFDARTTPISYAKIDTMPGTGRLIPGGLTRVNIDVNFWKDALSSRLLVGVSDPGAWLLHADTTDDYGLQYTSEIKDEEKGLWVQRGRQANHLWDCGVLQLVAIQMLDNQKILAHLIRQRQQKQEQSQTPRQRPQPQEQRTKLW